MDGGKKGGMDGGKKGGMEGWRGRGRDRGEIADLRLTVLANSFILYLCNVPDIIKVELCHWKGSPLYCDHRSKFHPSGDPHCKVQCKDVRLKGG